VPGLESPPLFDSGGLPGPGLPADGIAFNYDNAPRVGPINVDRQAVNAALSPGCTEAMALAGSRSIGPPILLATLLLTLVATSTGPHLGTAPSSGRGEVHLMA
jgi:hypothetical protein